MKYSITLTLLTFIPMFGFSQIASNYMVIRSKPSGDLIVQASLEEVGGKVYSSSPIGYGWFTITNKSAIVYPPKDEYLCVIQMFDSTGSPVPMRDGNKSFGRHFFDLKYPSPEQSWGDVEKLMRIKSPHGTQSASAENLFAGQQSTEGRSLPSPDDIFALQKPDNYILRMQFQVYVRDYKGGQSFTYKLERFEPVQFTVTKAIR